MSFISMYADLPRCNTRDNEQIKILISAKTVVLRVSNLTIFQIYFLNYVTTEDCRLTQHLLLYLVVNCIVCKS